MPITQAQQALLNAGTHSSGNQLTPQIINDLLGQGVSERDIAAAVASGSYNQTQSPEQAQAIYQNVLRSIEQAKAQGTAGQAVDWRQYANSIVLDSGHNYYVRGDGATFMIPMEAVGPLTQQGIPQVNVPGAATSLSLSGVVDTLEGALDAVPYWQQTFGTQGQQAQQQLQQSALGLAAKDGRTFGSLQQSDPNAYATFLAQFGGDLVAAATAWQAEANNAPLPQQQVAGAVAPPQQPGQVPPQQPGQTPPQQPQPAPGRTVTPGLQRWAAQHGGSYNGWDALSDAERQAWEAGSPQTPGAPTPAAGGKVQTPWGPADENTPPGGVGLDWWTQWAAMMDRLTDDSGVIRDPVTGKPLTNADGSLQKTLNALDQEARIRQKDEEIRQAQQRIDDLRRSGDLDRAQREEEYKRTLQLDRDRLGEDQRQFDAELGYKIGETLGRIDGQNTLDRDKFELDREQQLYNRAANPALTFENELARGSGGSFYNPATGRVEGGVSSTVAPVTTPAVLQGVMPQGQMVAQVIDPATGQTQVPGSQPQVRRPAFLNVLNSGGYTPTVGAINAPSTTMAANEAALGEDFFRLQNRKAEPRLTSVQKLIRSSYGRAGGVSDEQQTDLLNAGMPKETSLRPALSGR